MNRRQLLVGASALALLPTKAEARYRVPITLIEDTCFVPYSEDTLDWRTDTVIVSESSLRKMVDVWCECDRRPNGHVDWALVTEYVTRV